MTRILHVDHSPVLGGAERSVIELARSQSALGHDVIVAVGRSGPFAEALQAAGMLSIDLSWPRRYVEASSRISWVQAALGVPFTIVAAVKLRRAIRQIRPDIVHAHTRKAQLVSSVAGVGAGVPLVWHLRDYPPPRGPIRTALRVAIGRAAHAVALSRWLADRYLEVGLSPRSGRIDRVGSGVDPRSLDGMPTPWLSGDRQPIVGYLGNVASSKGAHVVVDVAERLADRPNVRFVIVGDVWFPHADRGYGSRLRARMRDSPAGDRVAWLETRSPREAMSAIDVLLHPSVEPEPFGRVLVEAMIARRPIVAVGHGGPAEILDGSTAKLTPPGDLDALAAAIRCVVDDRSASSAMADRARVLADEFEPMRIAKAMDAAYASMRR